MSYITLLYDSVDCLTVPGRELLRVSKVELGASNDFLVVFKYEEQREQLRPYEGISMKENGKVLRMQNDLAESPVATLQEFLKRNLAAC